MFVTVLICSECSEFPCPKLEQYTKCDSFLSHEKVMENLYLIKKIGIKKYVQQQKKRIKILENMLNNFNEGRSKSFYCIAATLLSIKNIENVFSKTNQKISEENINPKDFKAKARILRELFIKTAQKEDKS